MERCVFDEERWHTNVRRVAENIVVFISSSIQSSLFARFGNDESIRRRVAESLGRVSHLAAKMKNHSSSGFNHTSLCLPIGLNGESYPA